MPRAAPSSLPGPLASAVRRFAAWRGSRTSRCIPDDLWALATDLGARYGVSRTARALRIQYYDLKKRVEAGGGVDRCAAGGAPTFVEFVAAPDAAPAAAAGGYRIEFESPSGAKMRIEMPGAAASELGELSRLFVASMIQPVRG